MVSLPHTFCTKNRNLVLICIYYNLLKKNSMDILCECLREWKWTELIFVLQKLQKLQPFLSYHVYGYLKFFYQYSCFTQSGHEDKRSEEWLDKGGRAAMHLGGQWFIAVSWGAASGTGGGPGEWVEEILSSLAFCKHISYHQSLLFMYVSTCASQERWGHK